MALFLYSFNTVAPLILVVAVGFLLKRLRMVDDAFISKANKVCFQVAFPLQLFHNIYAADFGAEFRVKLVLFTLLGVLATAILLCLVTPRFLKNRPHVRRVYSRRFSQQFFAAGPASGHQFIRRGSCGVNFHAAALCYHGVQLFSGRDSYLVPGAGARG